MERIERQLEAGDARRATKRSKTDLKAEDIYVNAFSMQVYSDFKELGLGGAMAAEAADDAEQAARRLKNGLR